MAGLCSCSLLPGALPSAQHPARALSSKLAFLSMVHFQLRWMLGTVFTGLQAPGAP
jgi:hypothetical protein